MSPVSSIGDGSLYLCYFVHFCPIYASKLSIYLSNLSNCLKSPSLTDYGESAAVKHYSVI